MKIVQSFWTKPILEKKGFRWAGGWPNTKYNYLCWAFSCLQLQKFYKNVELITDQYGKHLLIDILKLPYTNVRVVLDELNLPTTFWNFGKIEAYRIQSEPFLHVDNDVFIWKKFNPIIHKASVIVQSEEFFAPKLVELAKKVESDLAFLPESYKSEIRRQSYIPNFNMGIIGGNNLDFFQDYTSKVLKHAQNHQDELPELEAGFLGGIIFEQFFLYMVSIEQKMNITCLFEKKYLTDIYFNNKFGELIRDHGYFHVHFLKNSNLIMNRLEQWMRCYYPDYYYRTMYYLQNFSL